MKLGTFDDNDLKKVQRLWSDFKSSTGATQATAASSLEMNQSAFSQYLRGEDGGGIPLNTNFVLKFCKLVGEDPKEFDIVDESEASEIKVRVTKSLTGARPTIPDVYAYTRGHRSKCYGVLMDSPEFPLGRNSVLIVEPELDIYQGDLVLLNPDDDIILGRMQTEKGGEWVLSTAMFGGFRPVPIKDGDVIHKVSSIELPKLEGKKFKRK